jgi:tetratricopeptide (TPR) repeat protein
MIHNNRGATLASLGRYDEACESYAEARRGFETVYGPVHSLVAMADNNLGNCAAHRGDYEEALAIHRRALATKLRTLGEVHPELGFSHVNIGRALLALGRLDKAADAFVAGKDAFSRGYDKEHPLVAEAIAGQAEVAWRRGDATAARALFERALQLSEDTKDSPLRDTVRFGLARALADEDPSRAMLLVQQVLHSHTLPGQPDLAAEVDAWLDARLVGENDGGVEEDRSTCGEPGAPAVGTGPRPCRLRGGPACCR